MVEREAESLDDNSFYQLFQVAGASGLSEKLSIGTLAHFVLNDTQLSIFFFCKLSRDTSLTLMRAEVALWFAASEKTSW